MLCFPYTFGGFRHNDGSILTYQEYIKSKTYNIIPYFLHFSCFFYYFTQNYIPQLHSSPFNARIALRITSKLFISERAGIMNLLNEDNVVHIFLSRIGDLVVANLLFIVCCIPIVTIGPAITALYHCTLRMVKGNDSSTSKTFFHAFKQNFLQSLVIWLGILLAGVILILNLRFLMQTQGASSYGKILLYMSEALMGLLVIVAHYIFPVIAAFANTAGKLLKNAFLFAFMHFPSTLAIAVITILPMYMTYQDLELMPLYACCWFFFGFALTAYIDSFLLYRIFRPFLEKEETPPAKGTPQK